MELSIDTEFKALMMPLTEEEYTELEQSIINEGCRDALVVWKKLIDQKKGYCKSCHKEVKVKIGDGNWECEHCGFGIYPWEYENILLDGHNRYEICKKHKISFNTIDEDFDERDDVKLWIIKNQLGRRNISKYDRSVLALKMKEIISKDAKEKQKESGGAVPQKSAKPPVDTRKEISKIADVSHDTIHKVEVIEKEAPKEIKEKIRKGETTINKVYNDIKRKEKREKRAKEKKVPLPKDEFDVIYADPAWRYNFNPESTRDPEQHYPTMELDEIKQMKVPSAKDSVLFLWCPPALLKEALEVMDAWGFEYKTNAIWDKTIIGQGHYFRNQHELLLLGTRGDIRTPEPENRISSIIVEKRTRHSKKPDVVYKIIGKMYPNHKYLELFAREEKEGWTTWGNEIKK